MDEISLGTEGLRVSRIGLGCMGLSQAYGPADDAESIATIRHAIDRGVSLIDTAMSYGAGHNETVVGRAIAGHRDEVVLATKVGIVRDEAGLRVDARPGRIRDDLHASLSRLDVDHVDLYYLHRVDPDVPVEESVGAMGELVDEGKVGHLGISESDVDALERAAATRTMAAVQSEWSLWWRQLEDNVIPAARRLGIGLVAYSPLGRGFLTGAVDRSEFDDDDLRRDDPRFDDAHVDDNTAALAALRRLATGLGLTPAQLALAWLVSQGNDVVPIPGTRHAPRVDENAAAADIRLSAADLADLEAAAPRRAWSGDRRAFGASRLDRIMS